MKSSVRRAMELLADEAQVVGRFEVGNPVVEETDAVRLAKVIQFVEPDRPLAVYQKNGI